MKKWIICLLPLLLNACVFQYFGDPTPDPDIAAAETAQEQLMQSIEATLTAIPSITPSQQGMETDTTALPTTQSTPLPTPASDSENTISSGNDMQLIYIPAGEFLMGSSKYDRDLETNEVPQHGVYLDAFWISQTQVTNAMYAQCAAEGDCQYSSDPKTNPHYYDEAYSDHPVVYLSWYAAMQYCVWSGGRLPTEAEWEKAARGTDGQKYTWGNTSPTLEQVNANNIVGNTTPAGQYPQGASPYGVLDMGGNVREWVWDWYDPYYYQYSPSENPSGPAVGEKKVLKGAGFSDIYRFVRPANRLAHDPTSPGINRGFRCVYE